MTYTAPSASAITPPTVPAPRPAALGAWAHGPDVLPAPVRPRRSRAYRGIRSLVRFSLVALVILALSACMALGAHELYDNGNPVGLLLWLAPVLLTLAAAGAHAIIAEGRN